MPTLISESAFLVLILEDWQIDFHMASWLPAVSAMMHTPGAPRYIGPWWHWWGSWQWTSVTLKPTVWWEWRCQGQCSPQSHCLWLQFQLQCGTWSQLWCDVWRVCLGSSMHSLALWSLSSCGGPSWLQNLYGSNAGRHEWGWPGP